MGTRVAAGLCTAWWLLLAATTMRGLCVLGQLIC
jgi:hypothetical protein